MLIKALGLLGVGQRIIQRSNLCYKVAPPNSSKLVNNKDWLSPSQTINIFNNLQDPNSALQLLDQISQRKDYTPNQSIYSAVLKHLALAKNFDYIDSLMDKIKFERKCRLSDDFFYDVIKVYGNLGGRINKAIYTLFDMPTYKCWPTIKTFNLVLNLLVSNKQFDVIHVVFMKAPHLGVEIDACCLNIVIKGLCHCAKFDAAFDVLNEFDKHNCRPNVRTFSTIMDGLCEHGRVNEALGFLERMKKEEIETDAITFNILIKGLRKQGKFQEGIEILDMMLLRGCEPNPGTYQEVLYCLLDAKSFVEAKEFTGKMIRKNVKPSFEAYKAMLDGFCKDRNVGNVEWVLKQMVRHRFKPRMGMWKQIVECVVPETDFSSFNHFPCK
ncbi:hypothetical protein LIER_13810 [Lithospermum erythrorhizon]|uniref:Pentatricopeptide repeat-containing protein n=1 Tax=Lithospermum erythrorhizon TaxID=34254 RepID=A0AAV3PYS2_LITER